MATLLNDKKDNSLCKSKPSLLCLGCCQLTPKPSTHLIWPINLKFAGHLGRRLVALGYRVYQGLVLVVGVVVRDHDVEHDTGVGDLQVFAALAGELQGQG